MALFVLFGTFTFLLLIGTPVAFCLGVASFATILYIGLPPVVVFQQLNSGISVFALMAIPFFIFAGELMVRGDIARRLVALAGKDGGLSLHFRDATSGRETYGGGRILKTADPDADGTVQVDLNRTVNLPCAFTAYATCPLPPAGNALDVAVEAGERTPPRPDLV